MLQLKCANLNDFLFIGLTQYGVSSDANSRTNENVCEIRPDDCLVTVDYLSNECNGLNSCEIELDAQFLHTCKNQSDYLSVAYECVPGAKRVDICSNEETFLIGNGGLGEHDPFGSFYLSSPNYPSEYRSDLNNCTCKLDYVHMEEDERDAKDKDDINLVLKVRECFKRSFRLKIES